MVNIVFHTYMHEIHLIPTLYIVHIKVSLLPQYLTHILATLDISRVYDYPNLRKVIWSRTTDHCYNLPAKVK